IVAAGFSGGEADQLRRAMAAWKRKGGLEPFRDKLIAGMTGRGYSEDFALQIYNQIKGFGEYGFPESHSASFALLAYVSSWLKFYYPAAFTCALLNSQPMGFYQPSQLVQDVQRHGVKVLPVDVNQSDYDCSLVLPSESVTDRKAAKNSASWRRGAWQLRLGLGMVRGLSAAAAQRICAARRQKAFVSVEDFLERCAINARDRESLAAADALRGLAGNRHLAHWEVVGYQHKLPLEAVVQPSDDSATSLPPTWPEAQVMLPPPSEAQDIIADYNSVDLTLRRHPPALLRGALQQHAVTPAQQLPYLQNGC